MTTDPLEKALDIAQGLDVRRFRCCTDPFPAAARPDLPRHGLEGLRVAGSAQFSERGLATIAARLGGPLTVVDLREESHGFEAGLPVSWRADRNWANRGKSIDEIEADEAQRLAGRGKTERRICADLGLDYERLPVCDHCHPQAAVVDRFQALLAKRHGWLLLHCRGGRGRTTTFLALVDLLANAGAVRFEDILERHRQLDGSDLLHRPPRGIPWRDEAAEQRRQFLRRFHAYSLAGAPGPWSAWPSAHLPG